MTQFIHVMLALMLVHFVIRFSVTWNRTLPCAGRWCKARLSLSFMLMVGGAFLAALGPERIGAACVVGGAVVFFQIISQERRRHGRHYFRAESDRRLS